MTLCKCCGVERAAADFWPVGRYRRPDSVCKFCRLEQARERRRDRDREPTIVTNQAAALFLRLPRFRLYHPADQESAPLVVTTTA